MGSDLTSGWDLPCSCRSEYWEKVWQQMLHSKGAWSTVCVFMCIFRSNKRMKGTSQKLQENIWEGSWWFFMWRNRSDWWAYAFPQILHTKGLIVFRTFGWVFKCTLNWSLSSNSLSQTMHLKTGFSLECVSMWLTSSQFWMKTLPHWSHLNGRSPVCLFMWRRRWQRWLNMFPHTSHRKGLCPVCVRICRLRWPLWLNALSHMVHLYGRSPECVRLWILSVLACPKPFPH